MQNHVIHILRKWEPHKDSAQWVLGVIYKTEGSCYRKAGAMVMFNSLGQQLGLLSGGCLESDIKLNSQKVMQESKPRCLTYDDSDEDDISFKLGVGCGGVVHLVLLPVTKSNNYLLLDQLLSALEAGKSCTWQQEIAEQLNTYTNLSTHQHAEQPNSKASLEYNNDKVTLNVPITAPPHLLVVGGGLDAFHVTRLASQTGWQVSIWDPRPAQARRSDFPFVDEVISEKSPEYLALFITKHNVDAVIFMSHSKTIDAKALSYVYSTPVRYIGMLGPKHRKEEVLASAKVEINEQSKRIAGPVGLDIGGDLPEQIALSVLAECHAALFKRTAKSISNVLTMSED
ncbi:XdhC family protein [Thalassotalea eurytherma]|uniref:Xanthine and CO dehydrogenase family maturation factor XdhC/CoxF family protein n=1 Tax=Thalassotalea eurytherma TaxID=1144278 RepID=A0ABQ6H3R0_9GAMM|nr:XdhC/CoxI family protein [Thalassotalea eurytherma]GLX81481.1 xanthine and CO dehydrogenase family maturation factor XdhC/CoxF family protein [Thalassotalea eurytherma]